MLRYFHFARGFFAHIHELHVCATFGLLTYFVSQTYRGHSIHDGIMHLIINYQQIRHAWVIFFYICMINHMSIAKIIFDHADNCWSEPWKAVDHLWKYGSLQFSWPLDPNFSRPLWMVTLIEFCFFSKYLEWLNSKD